MAQQDTGMGWEAKAEWLAQFTGEIARFNSIGGDDFQQQPIPETGATLADAANMWANGLTIAVNTNNGRTAKVGSAVGVPVLLAWDSNTIGAGQRYLWAVSPANTTPNACARVIVFTPQGSVYTNSSIVTTNLDVGTGLYWARVSVGTSMSDFFVLPDYSTVADMLADISVINGIFNKENPGYSVACIAKWKSAADVTFTSPLLISSDSSFADMTLSGASGFNFAKLSVLYKGIRFYMGFWDSKNLNLVGAVPTFDKSGSDDPILTLNDVFELIASSDYANIQVTNPPDPYHEPESEEDGGDGEEDEAEDIDFTEAPATLITSSGFLTIFCPSLAQLLSLAGFMWSSFDVDNWRKLFANPMDAILGLHIIPVHAPTSGQKTVNVAGISTGQTMDYTTQRYITLSVGHCTIPKKWGAYLDYSPYTKVSIFLPYIGFKEIDADEIMGETIEGQYIIDILTGACVAELKCGGTVLYSWEGNCANPVPISSSNWTSALTSALSIAATVATVAATGGASAPMIAGTIASVGANSLNLKPTINRSGSIGGSGGFIAGQTPYIIRSIPNLVIPADQNKFIGYPSFVTASLGSLTGYNEISSIHLEGIPATVNELNEIESLLKGGVIF